LERLVFALQHYTKKGFIAEGVETEKELQAIKGFGMKYAQGFLLGKPKESV